MTKEEIRLKFQSGKFIKISKFFFLLLVFLAPIFFLPLTTLPVEINKMQLAILLVVISFVSYLSNAILTKTIVYPKSFFSLLIFLIFVLAAISSIFSEAVNISFFGNLYQPDSLIGFLIYFLAFVLASSIFNKKDFVFLGLSFAAATAPVLVLGLFEMKEIYLLPFDFTKNAAFNTIGTVTNYGFFAAFILILAISIISEFKLALIPKLTTALLAILALSNLVLLNNKLLWAIISLAMLLVVAKKFTESANPHQPQNSLKNKPAKMEFSLVIMIISFLFFIIGPSLPPLANLPVELKPTLTSTFDAVKYNFSLKNALIGSGPSTFSYNFTINRPVELNETNFWSLRFNEGYSFLTTLISTMGIIETILFVSLALYLIFFLVKNGLSGKLFPVSLGVLFLMAGLFVLNSFFVGMLALFIGFGLIIALNSSYGEISLEKIPKNFSFIIFIIIITAITGSLAILFITSQKYVAAIYYQKAIESKDIDSVLKNLDVAVKLDPDSDMYLRTASQSLIIDANNEASKKDKSSPDDLNSRIQNDIALAVRAAQKATVINPIDSLNWANLGNIYEQIMTTVDGADLFAENNYKEAIRRDPKNFELEFSLARSLMASADKIKVTESQKNKDPKATGSGAWQTKLDEANSHLERAIELNGKYAPAHFQIAMILVRRGEIEKAASKLEETKIFAPYDSTLYFQLGLLYYNNNKIDNARTEFEKAVSLNENYSDARYVLGLLYDKEKKNGSALEQFEKVLKLNPDSEDVKKIIANLKAGKPAIEQESKSELPVEPASPEPSAFENTSEEQSKEDLNIIPKE